VEQLATAFGRLHGVLHAPQFVRVLKLASQPSILLLPLQSPYPAMQADVHVPLVHVGETTLTLLQGVPHAPQLFAFVKRLSSQPSVLLLPLQSPNPILHVDVHVPLVHVLAATLFELHAMPQPPQLSGSALLSEHEPEQQEYPAAHAFPHPPQLFSSVPKSNPSSIWSSQSLSNPSHISVVGSHEDYNTHKPLGEHKKPALQSELNKQLVGQKPLAPLQTYGAHDGLPGLPAGSMVQVPSIVAPKACAQVSQAPLHAELQQ